MKVRDILTPQQERLDEISLKQAIAAGMIGTAAMSPRLAGVGDVGAAIASRPATTQTTQATQQEGPQDVLVSQVVDKYNIDPKLAEEVVTMAHKYEHPDFPTAKDILAIVGIESSFRPQVKSQLKRDPARGLMQVRPGVWNLDPEELEDIETNIKHGANILHQYYKKIGTKQGAVQAYNIGITTFRKGERNPNYLQKYQREYGELLSSIVKQSEQGEM